MNLLALNGSPRRDGNTVFYLNRVLEVVAAGGITTELLHLIDYVEKPCTACMECWHKRSLCVLDDRLPEVCGKMLDADGILLGSPVYYGGVTSTMKAFIDRSGYGLWATTGFRSEDWDNPTKAIRPLRNKVGAAVVTGYRIGMTSALSQMLLYLLDMEMVIVSGTWTAGMQCSAWTAPGEYDVHKDKEGLLYAQHLGENLAHVMTALHSFD